MKTKALRIILFFLVIIIILCFTLFGEKETVSYNENKTLAEFPKFSFENWKNRSFMNGMADYFSDHFVLREKFIQFKNSIDKIIGKDEINGVVEAEGYLIQTFRDPDMTLTDKNLSVINKLKSKNPDTDFYFMPVITAQENLKDRLPSYLALASEAEYISDCFKKLNDVVCIDVSEEIQNTDYAFYRTDHHWTTESAFAAYRAMGDVLGYTPLSESDFDIKTVSTDFKGTLYSKTLNEKIKADSIKSYLTDTEFNVTIKDKKYDSLYFDEYLSEKDKYSYFLGGNHGICTVENKKLDNGKSLLIIKDSYANCLVPFLAEHYSKITLVDPRYCSYGQLEEIDPSGFDGVLILFNVSGFSDEQSFALTEFLGGNEK